MNNTKRKILTGVIAAVVCFTMILGSFGAIIGAAFGILSNEDLINAINNGSLYLGDGVNLSNITLNGGNITDVAKDGYDAVSSNEIADKKADYNQYNKPFYPDTALGTSATVNSVAYTVEHATGAHTIFGVDNVHLGDGNYKKNYIYYVSGNVKSNYRGADEPSQRNTLFIDNGYSLVLAMDTAEKLVADGSILSADVFADGLLAGKTVYGVCLNQVLLVSSANSSLTILGRDFNNNKYIDDVPVQVTVGTATYWFYEKFVISGSTAFQAFDSSAREKYINNSSTYVSNIPGQAYPLIRMVGEYNATDANLKCQLIISGADLRNNFNSKNGGTPDDTSKRYNAANDVTCGGGAIYLASDSANGAGRTSSTYGMFKNVVITNTRFSHCGSIRGGAVMVGKNFYCPQGVLDFSYSDFTYCYTAYFSYGYTGYSRFVTLSGDGGAVCFYQDDTHPDAQWFHKNPSLIYIAKVDFTGATFTYCYAMRSGGALHFGGYYYNKKNNPSGAAANAGTDKYNVQLYGHKEYEIGTRIDELLLDHCSFYGCGAGWQIANPPMDANGNVLDGASFILTNAADVLPIAEGNSIFTNMLSELGITTIAAGATTNATNSALYTMRGISDTTNTAQADIRWMQCYDGNSSNDNTSNWKIYASGNATYNTNKARRTWNRWVNILDTRIYGGAINGGAINANCRIAKITISNSTFEYCAADNNGSVMYMEDYFACPDMTFSNCLFENNLCTVSNRDGGTMIADTGTVRATGISAANITFDKCSFLYNCNMGNGALYLNINNTYDYDTDNGVTNSAYKKYYVTDPGTEVNDSVFFGNFAHDSGAAIFCSGVMDVNSSTFAHNFTNSGQGGAITFKTYSRGGIIVSATEAQMRLDPDVAEGDADGNTIVCNNMVGTGPNSATSGGGGIAVIVDHSVSVGDRSKGTAGQITSGSYKTYPYSFDFELGGVLVFNNHSNNAGGGILYRVTNENNTGKAVNAWVYNKSITLDKGHIFNNDALQYGGGVAVRDEYSLLKDISKATISGANVCGNEAGTVGGGIYLYVKNGKIDMTGGHVLANTATTHGGGIMIQNTPVVNISGGQIGSTEYTYPNVVLTSAASTFTNTGIKIAGGNKAGGVGGGIYILNEISASTFIDKNTAVNMTGGLVEGNIATSDGGGLYMVRPTDNTTYGKITFTMSEPGSGAATDGGASAFGFVGNTAVQGGGIYISSGNVDNDAYRYTATINGGAINKNVTSSYGGGMFITGMSLVQLNGGSVNENESGNNGGGIYINANSEFNMTGGQLSGNKTTAMGGGLYTYNANANVDGGSIASNTAATNGGGACVRGGAVLTVSGGNFSTNTATSGNGGGIYIDGSGSTSTIKVPSDGITILNVAVWTQAVGADAKIGSKADTMVSKFKTFLEKDLGYTMSALDLNFEYFDSSKYSGADNAAKNENAVKDMAAKFPNGSLHVIVGGAANIYNTQVPRLGSTPTYDKWYTANISDTAKFQLSSAYHESGSNRTVAPLTVSSPALHGGSYDTYMSKISVLAELFYRFVLNSSTYSATTASTINSKYSHLAPVSKTIAGDGSKAVLTAGTIAGNVAANGFGGGVGCENNASVKMNATSATTYPVIDGNTAKNGGGVAVIEGSDLTMQGGYVINNKAVGTSTGTVKENNKDVISTHMQHSANGGVGGGIYVANAYKAELNGSLPDGDNMATFTISLTNDKGVKVQTGIYLNNAQFAADDVFANAYGTQLNVPAFDQMTVKDNGGKPTGWFEDYANGEPRYYKGLIGNETVTSAALATATSVERYDTASAAGRYTYEAWITKASMDANRAVDNTSNPTHYINDKNAYVCVTLGAYVVYDGNLTITKDIDGTVDTEQVFLFHVKRLLDQYGNEASDVNIFVTINGEGSVTISSLPLGTYEVTEMTEWSWRYSVTKTAISATRGTVSDDSATANDAIVEFEIIPIDVETGACNDPKITFTNKLTKTPWLDGNSPKVVNTAGATKATFGEVAYTNFKREETLI